MNPNDRLFSGIPSRCDWKRITQLDKGWSEDRKFLIEDRSGQKYLLRVSNRSHLEKKKREFAFIRKLNRLDFAMSAAREFGVCNQGESVYLLLSWVEGVDLEQILPALPEEEQYRLGVKAGAILRKIHGVPLDGEDIPGETKIPKKLRQLEKYETSRVRIPGDETALRFVKDHIREIWSLPPVYLHGDFHPGNLILLDNHQLGVIDFNRWEVGDPYEEFYKLESFGVERSVPYCVGQIDRYFDGAVPEEFWRVLAVYVAHASLYSIKWAEPFGQGEIQGMIGRCRAAFEHYDAFRRTVPRWYSEYRNQSFM